MTREEKYEYINENFKWFCEHLSELIKIHNLTEEDFIIISDKQFVAKLPSYEEAHAYAKHERPTIYYGKNFVSLFSI